MTLPLTDRAMMSPVRFNTATLWTFEYHLALLETHPLNILFGSVAPEKSTVIISKTNQKLPLGSNDQ